ncbi:MAG TPA: SLBB domain-containing protein [Myxococcota bacterium]|nr:SLBB domain-containing protein [Myxococcota bacterium]
MSSSDSAGWSRSFGWATALPMALAAALGFAAAARAQSGDLAADTEISEEQRALFESLSPDRQRELVEQALRASDAGEKGERSAAPTAAASARQLERRALAPDRDAARATPDALEAGSSVLIDLTPRELADARHEALRERIQRGNPYLLDRLGRLELPGFEPLPLGGLDEELAAARLATDPELAAFAIRVKRLPLQRTGADALRPFGYELFTDAPSTFAPAPDTPVPSNYVVGAGDILRVQLFGSTNRSLSLEVGRDGQIDFPQLGPIAVDGMRFDEAKEQIEARVADQMSGVRANVEMGETRSIRVFLLGEVARPGSYTVSGLSTVTNALFVSGGISRVGSLRNVQLKRSGKLVQTLDLYDLLLKGDTSDDAALLPGDVVFIPPIGPSVGASGEVLRPALYEIAPGATLAELLSLCGGLAPEADASAAHLERLSERGERIVESVDLGSAPARAVRLRSGDRLHVPRVRATLEGAVVVDGHVLRPGPHEYRPGLRLGDVLSFADLEPKADTHYVLIRRELGPDRRVVAISADLAAALEERGGPADLPLAPRDRLTVFDRESGRDRVVSALMRELRSQATHDQPLQIASVAGRVRAPGQYPLEPEMRVSDLLRAGGSLEDAAYGGKAELTRHQVVDGEFRETELVEVDLGAVLRGDPAADLALAPYDTLTVKELPEWREQEAVTISGEVRFPGDYQVRRGETLYSVLQRAGGLTDLAFAEGAVFLREDLREREQQQLDQLEHRLRRDLAVMALQGGPPGEPPRSPQLADDLLSQLQSARAVGRLVIDLPAIVSGEERGSADILLKPGDRLIVPKESQEVTVIGEVQNPTSHRHVEGLSRDEYVELSGGFTEGADKRKLYVVRASGSVVAKDGGAWFELGSREIHPGDTIVVPLAASRMRPITLWTAATQILFNLAIAAAAVNSF